MEMEWCLVEAQLNLLRRWVSSMPMKAKASVFVECVESMSDICGEEKHVKQDHCARI